MSRRRFGRRRNYYAPYWEVYCVPSGVWTVPSLCLWKFLKFKMISTPTGSWIQIESNCPSGSKISEFQNFHEHRDVTVTISMGQICISVEYGVLKVRTGQIVLIMNFSSSIWIDADGLLKRSREWRNLFQLPFGIEFTSNCYVQTFEPCMWVEWIARGVWNFYIFSNAFMRLPRRSYSFQIGTGGWISSF